MSFDIGKFKDRKTVKGTIAGQSLDFNLLTIGEVEALKEIYKNAENSEDDNLDSLIGIIHLGIQDAQDLTLEDLKSMPIFTVKAMVSKIMSVNNLAGDSDGKK